MGEHLLGKAVSTTVRTVFPQRETVSCLSLFSRGEKTTRTHVADIDSNPTASPTSISPLRIWFDTAETAIKPEEQKLREDKRQ